jgi:tetratricopeptide (TPR) repeat protein
MDESRLAVRSSCRSRPARSRVVLAATIATPVILLGALAAVLVNRPWDPGRPASLRDALLAVKDGDRQRARAAVRDLRAGGRHDEAALAQASILLAQGLPEAAVLALARVPEGGGFDTSRRLLLAEAAHRRGRHRDVVGLLLPVVARRPDAVDAHRLLAASFYDTGAVAAALEHLREVARLAPNDPRPHRLMGLLHNDFERFDEAIPLYEESLRRAPDQPDRDDVLLELAACLAAQRRFDEAIAALDRRTGTGPAENVLRAECLLALGERGRAGTLLDGVLATDREGHEAREPDPTRTVDAALRKALVLKGSLALEEGDPPAAISSLEQAAADPHDYAAHHLLSRALAADGRDAEAAECRGRAEAIRGRRQAFAELHREAWEHPWDAAVRLRLADAAAALGRPDLEQVWRAAAAAVGETAPRGSAEPTAESEAREASR